MGRKTPFAAASVAVLLSTPALAQEYVCQSRIDQQSGEYGDVLEGSGYGAAQSVLLDLRNSALRLQTQGLDQACVETIEAMEVALAAYRQSDELGDTEIVASPELGNIEERAIPFGEAHLETSAIEGADLYNYGNDYLGEVRGVVMDAARPTHVVVGKGGFWDTGASQAAVPATMLRWDPEWDAFFVPLTAEALEQAPDYRVARADWSREANDRYYQDLID